MTNSPAITTITSGGAAAVEPAGVLRIADATTGHHGGTTASGATVTPPCGGNSPPGWLECPAEPSWQARPGLRSEQ
ncbi:hypothetical protein [Streptomyces brasiliscabiei]|uniref:hypothetical protein n=1 Tax=Streptomyces brasiliscabiei TaxID=2736302 RepID=UPI001C10494A|nr:hypothetical protein [Streptomyces brasiliscabiei]